MTHAENTARIVDAVAAGCTTTEIVADLEALRSRLELDGV